MSAEPMASRGPFSPCWRMIAKVYIIIMLIAQQQTMLRHFICRVTTLSYFWNFDRKNRFDTGRKLAMSAEIIQADFLRSDRTMACFWLSGT